MIVSCGEALIDFVPARTVAGENAYVPRPGGSPFNVAVAAGRLGVAAAFLGSVSTDFFGAHIVAALRRSGVDTRYVTRLDLPTMLAFVELGAAEPAYTFYDAAAASGAWAPASDLGAEPAILHFGSISLVTQPAAGHLCDLMARERQARIVTIDPNIRPVIATRDQAAYRARLTAMLGYAHLIKVSLADLTWLMPNRTAPAVAADWIAAGTSLVVVTAGDNGATAFTADGRTIHQAADNIHMIDTVGAGDSFMGAFLAGLTVCGVTTRSRLAAIDPSTVDAVLAFATKVAAITCSRAGADPPWRDEITLPVPAGRAKGTP